MLIKSLADCPPLIANDGCRVFEVLHPKNDSVELPYSLAVAEVEPGDHSYRHRLAQTEVYYVLAGQGRMHVDDAACDVVAGDAIVIPSGAVQWIENRGADRLRFIAIVSPPWRAEDDERL